MNITPTLHEAVAQVKEDLNSERLVAKSESCYRIRINSKLFQTSGGKSSWKRKNHAKAALTNELLSNRHDFVEQHTKGVVSFSQEYYVSRTALERLYRSAVDALIEEGYIEIVGV